MLNAVLPVPWAYILIFAQAEPQENEKTQM
jgi:hypothetical protein